MCVSVTSMFKTCCLLAIILLFRIQSSECFGPNFWKLRELFTQSSSQHNGKGVQKDGVEHFLEQHLDHFNSQDEAVYKQRYFVNTEFFKSPHGPVFLFIGGESPISERKVLSGFHYKAAKQFGALIFAVEHRFYGQSMNDDGLKLENLKYLSSQQALADLAHFHEVMSNTYNLTDSNKWICFGGSYPGSLSAWFRLKYPHLVIGAVSSSSPVRALTDFQGYNDVVAKSLATDLVGGSEECVRNIRMAFSQVDDLLNRKEYSKLEKDFKSCSPMTSNVLDIFLFASNTADIFMGTVQYNNILARSVHNIEEICRDMTASSDAYQNLVSLYQKFMKTLDSNCTDNSWVNYINVLKNVTVDKPFHLGIDRQWLYQTCAQFGYYQTCEDNTECLFSKYLSLAPNLEICREIFGISPARVYENVEFTNSYYGSDEPRGSNILFVNGLIDPWHALSVLHNLTDTENALVIPGTAHCADMWDDSDKDPLPLKQAREVITSKLQMWLEPIQHKPMRKLFYNNNHASNKKRLWSRL